MTADQPGPFYSLWQFHTQDTAGWMLAARASIEVLQIQPGFVEAHIMSSPDDTSALCVHSTWSDVGSYRRAVGSTQAKMVVWPFLANMIDQPSAFEALMITTADSTTHYSSSVSD